MEVPSGPVSADEIELVLQKMEDLCLAHPERYAGYVPVVDNGGVAVYFGSWEVKRVNLDSGMTVSDLWGTCHLQPAPTGMVATVNNRRVPPGYRLENGDTVRFTRP